MEGTARVPKWTMESAARGPGASRGQGGAAEGLGGVGGQGGHPRRGISLGSCYQGPGLRTGERRPEHPRGPAPARLTGGRGSASPVAQPTQPAPQASSCTSRVGPSAAVKSISPRRWPPSSAAGETDGKASVAGHCPGAWRGAPGPSGPWSTCRSSAWSWALAPERGPKPLGRSRVTGTPPVHRPSFCRGERAGRGVGEGRSL